MNIIQFNNYYKHFGIFSVIKSVLPFGNWLDLTSYFSNRFINLLQEIVLILIYLIILFLIGQK